MTQVLSSIEVERAAPVTAPAGAGRGLMLLAQLALAGLVVYLYEIEGSAFFRLFAVAFAGFGLNLVLPAAYRLQAFVLLSLAGVFVVFGAIDGAWLIAAGLVLIGACHLPFSLRVRVAVLLGLGAVLAASRGGLIESPWSVAVWPILGSMFMFRLVLYMMALKGDKQGGKVWGALAYFFMLPNLVFPLFPVVDYQTFRRTHFDRGAFAIYEQGLLWITRGLVHLLLYRLVYHSVLNDPADVVQLSDLVRFMVGTFLLYLRVSGQFHLIVGILHLFGFRLPETHKLYYLAHSFTELWRRINIYWTDFMMKTVFYPTYFKVKKLGPSRALAVSTAAVFVTTWILHSYQWFWLRGGFPLTAQDTLFWGVLGALVVTGALKELNGARKPRQRPGTWNWRLGLRAAVTFSLFCFLWSLWSTESVIDWVWMLGAASNMDAAGVGLLVLVLGTIFVLGGRDWETAPAAARPGWMAIMLQPAVRVAFPLAVLVAAALPGVRSASPEFVAAGITSMHTTGLNAVDAARQHRGYYEQLDVRAQATNAQVLDKTGQLRRDWQELAATGMVRERNDILTRDLQPSKSVVRNGETFTTNSWGMRDKAYTREKPAGTFRIALLGPSHVMGNGVSDGETFEAIVEQRLNQELQLPGINRIEILNFGVDGFSLSQQVALLEARVLAFSPDMVIATHYHQNRAMTEGHVLKLLTRSVPIPDSELEGLLLDAGFDFTAGDIPVPFASGRQLARWIGIDARMPTGEAQARARRIADDVMGWSFRKFAGLARAHGIRAAVLGLNAVIDDAPGDVPYQTIMDDAGLPLINLFDVFPPDRRADLRVAPWDDHPNAAGHRLIADSLYPKLAELLPQGNSPTVLKTNLR